MKPIPIYEVKDVQPQASIPWNITMINAPSFWTKTQGEGVVVAVIDTGLDLNHPELEGRIVSPKNFVSPWDMVADEDGHGTHVAGIVAGKTCGVAPEARIMPLKVFGNDQVDENIKNAFRFILKYNETAADFDKVAVVNCSFGSGGYDPELHYLIRKLTLNNVSVVVAAGNSGDGRADTEEIFSFPAYLAESITTGALTREGVPALYSNSFYGLDVAAPGTEIYSSWPGGGYKLLSGTSMATPHTAGAIALINSSWRLREGVNPSAKDVLNVLGKHTRAIPIDARFVGNGIIDLEWVNNKWPLYHVQVGAFYNESGALSVQKALDPLLIEAGIKEKSFIPKY